MLMFATILGFVLTFLILALTIYLFGCAIITNSWIRHHGGLTDENLGRLLSQRTKVNLPLNLALKIAQKAHRVRNINSLVVKQILIRMKTICFSIAGSCLVASIYVLAFSASMYSLNAVTTSVTSAISWILEENEECNCYALCTGDKDLDTKCTYEILFGEDAYNEFVNEIEEYISSSEPYDKAGAYGIQGLASKFIRGIEGDYFNVVGLPVSSVYKKIIKKK